MPFGTMIRETVHTFHDDTRTRLPSYRERVVQVRLSRHEGGLNLEMGPAAIGAMQDKGRRAEQTLGAWFDLGEHQ